MVDLVILVVGLVVGFVILVVGLVVDLVILVVGLVVGFVILVVGWVPVVGGGLHLQIAQPFESSACPYGQCIRQSGGHTTLVVTATRRSEYNVGKLQ